MNQHSAIKPFTFADGPQLHPSSPRPHQIMYPSAQIQLPLEENLKELSKIMVFFSGIEIQPSFCPF